MDARHPVDRLTESRPGPSPHLNST